MNPHSFMRLFFVLLVFSIPVVAQNPLPSATPPDDETTVKITTSLIQLDVVVMDKDGKEVTDLEAEDFYGLSGRENSRNNRSIVCQFRDIAENKCWARKEQAREKFPIRAARKYSCKAGKNSYICDRRW